MVARQVPLDLIPEILSFLPSKSVLRFTCVCKEWYNLLNTPLFAKLQLNKSLKPDSRHNRILISNATLSISIVDDVYHPLKLINLNWPKDTIRHDNHVSIVGSCNGLVCLEVSRMNDLSYFRARCFLLICNPTKRTFKLILTFSEKKWTEDSLSYGFGYVCEHDDYKIVAARRYWTENDRQVCIYSLKTDLWSWSKPPPTRVSTERFWINDRVIFENNMLHYLVSSLKGGVTEDYRIVRFDIVSEKWIDDLSLPVPALENNFVRLRKLDGWLCLHVGDFDVNSSEVWMMEEYGSWKKMFRLPQAVNKQWLIARSKDGCHSLLVHEYDDNKDFWYDQRDNTRTSFTLKRLPEDRQTFMLCIASLVAIPGCSFTKLQQVEHEA